MPPPKPLSFAFTFLFSLPVPRAPLTTAQSADVHTGRSDRLDSATEPATMWAFGHLTSEGNAAYWQPPVHEGEFLSEDGWFERRMVGGGSEGGYDGGWFSVQGKRPLVFVIICRYCL